MSDRAPPFTGTGRASDAASHDAAAPGRAAQIVLFRQHRAGDRQLMQSLRTHGFRLLDARSADNIITLAQSRAVALVLLRLRDRGRLAPSLCREVKAVTDVPIVVLAERSAACHCEMALEIGADDYIARPASGREIAARIKAILRRTSRTVGTSGLVLDRQCYVATLDGRPLGLTPAEFRLLAALDGRRANVISREELVRAVHSERLAGDRALDSLMRNLRRKLRAVRPNENSICAAYGLGYRLRV